MLNISDVENMNKKELSEFVTTFNQYIESEESTKLMMKNKINELEYELEQSRNLLHNLTETECEKDECENNEGGWSEEETELMANAYAEAEKDYIF